MGEGREREGYCHRGSNAEYDWCLCVFLCLETCVCVIGWEFSSFLFFSFRFYFLIYYTFLFFHP